MRKFPVLVALACGFASMTNSLAAQLDATPQMRAASLSEVVVSGSRNEQAIDELAMSVDVINADDIEQGQMRDIRDVAKNLPNVSVKRAPARFGLVGGGSDGRDGNAGFNIRGLDGNRVLLLVDGIRAVKTLTVASRPTQSTQPSCMLM